MIRHLALAAALLVVAKCAHAEQKPPPPQQPVRCIKDSFGNLRCTGGTTVLPDSNGNFTIIPPRRER
jgi:hypothetical protein